MSFPRYPRYKDSGVEWLGEVPDHWEVTRLRFAATINPSKTEGAHLSPTTDVSFLPMEAIGEDGTIDLGRHRVLSELQSGYTYFRDGDVLVAKITPCFENGKGAVAAGLVNGIGFGTTELIVARPVTGRMDGRFLDYLFRSREFRALGEAQMYGAGGQKRVPDSFVRDFATGLPPFHEQCAVAAFLDCETAKIDALISEQQRLIELLKEKRQAVISHAVTRGLNPEAPMKPSGVEWLGDVPAHWEVQRVKTVSTFTTSGPRGWSDRVGDDGALFIQSGDLDDELRIRFAGAKRVRVEDGAEATRTKLLNGDIVVCITGAKTGNVAVCAEAPEDAYVNQHLCLVRPAAEVHSAFLGHLLKSGIGQSYFSVSQYGLKQGLSLEDVREAPVLIPPMPEQVAIVEFLSLHMEEFSALLSEVEKAMVLLQERRTALISAAVTGKIDVRGLAMAEAA